MVRIQYVGHSTILVLRPVKIVIDPYLKNGKKGKEGLERYNPNAVMSVKELIEISPDLILLTHGHGDHFGQTFEILERTNAKLVASNKVCDFVNKSLRERLFDEQRLLRIEPGMKLKFGETIISSISAKHKHGLEGIIGDVLGMLAYKRYTPCGTNMGYLISLEGKRIYHSGDTHIVKDVYIPDIAFLSMDGFRTLNEKEAIDAIIKIKPKIVIPVHYRWHRRGGRIIKNVKKAIEAEESILFKEMGYGEIIDV